MYNTHACATFYSCVYTKNSHYSFYFAIPVSCLSLSISLLLFLYYSVASPNQQWLKNSKNIRRCFSSRLWPSWSWPSGACFLRNFWIVSRPRRQLLHDIRRRKLKSKNEEMSYSSGCICRASYPGIPPLMHENSFRVLETPGIKIHRDINIVMYI